MIKIGIYKITNLLDGKNYIGQSRDIYRRWAQHKSDAKAKNLPLYRAIRKYGIQNFSFEILEECQITELAQKEDFYIEKYNAFIPYGYNYNKAETHFTNIAIPEKYKYIKNLLKNSSLSLTEIGKEVGLTGETISRINRGITWRQDNESYPLRAVYEGYDDSQIIPLLKQGYTISNIGKILGTSEATIQGWMQSRNIHTSDYRKRLTSNRPVLQLNDKKEIIQEFPTIKAAAIFLQSITGASFNTSLCGIKRNLEKLNLYKGYYWKYKYTKDNMPKR